MSKIKESKQARFEVAKTVLARYMALAIKDGFNPEDEATKQFLEDERKLNEYDEATIEKILSEYAPYIKVGEDNE